MGQEHIKQKHNLGKCGNVDHRERVHHSIHFKYVGTHMERFSVPCTLPDNMNFT